MSGSDDAKGLGQMERMDERRLTKKIDNTVKLDGVRKQKRPKEMYRETSRQFRAEEFSLSGEGKVR